MPDQKKYLVVILGPTAIGKTVLTIAAAKHFSSEILSADSRQFFREMKIGTAVPDSEELAAVPHHFIHHISVNNPYSVGDFEKDAIQLLEDKFKFHKILFLTGGSGLYIDAVTKGLDDFPEINPKIRKELNDSLEKNGIEELQKKLFKLDPAQYSNMDIHNPQRVIRALEICIGTGQAYSTFLTNKKANRNFETIKIGLTGERKDIYNRINERVDIMIENGLVEEVKELNKYRHLNALQTVGYKEIFDFLNGNSTLGEAIEEVKKNTRRYAKRQLTWFKKDETIKWFDYKTEIQQIIEYINSRTS